MLNISYYRRFIRGGVGRRASWRRGAVRSHWTLLNCKHSGRTLSLFRRPLYPTLLVIRVFVGACLGTCRVVSTNYKVTWRLLRATAVAGNSGPIGTIGTFRPFMVCLCIAGCVGHASVHCDSGSRRRAPRCVEHQLSASRRSKGSKSTISVRALRSHRGTNPMNDLSTRRYKETVRAPQ